MAKRKRTARKSLGKAFAGDLAVVILRSTGQVLNRVNVRERAFRVQTPDLGILTIPTQRVKTIVYKNLPSYPTDMLRTVSSSELNGVILNDPVEMESEDLGGVARLPKAKILSIVW